MGCPRAPPLGAQHPKGPVSGTSLLGTSPSMVVPPPTFDDVAVAPPLYEERHWTSPGMAAALQSLIKTPLSERISQALLMTPRLLDVVLIEIGSNFLIGILD
ncbi:hypothetical protein Syun_025269 [Stephania yunnanensis]|uniref:Uncharacterized protein n=1 Tax=Stephania yunnanensis TaxID=152371 RepID=A0AAP0ERW1_9MAGN